MWCSLRPRHVFGLLPWVFGLVALASLPGCGTDPVNPDGCKQIEFARCQAAPACPDFSTDFDVEACERFYRDQCLKGLQTANDPGKPKIDSCTRAIEKAGECARNGISPCPLATREIADPCGLITLPEMFTECGFLDDGFEEDAGLSPFQDAEPDNGDAAPEEEAAAPENEDVPVDESN